MQALFGELSADVIVLTILYSLAGLGIAIVNDFKSIEGDRCPLLLCNTSPSLCPGVHTKQVLHGQAKGQLHPLDMCDPPACWAMLFIVQLQNVVADPLACKNTLSASDSTCTAAFRLHGGVQGDGLAVPASCLWS